MVDAPGLKPVKIRNLALHRRTLAAFPENLRPLRLQFSAHRCLAQWRICIHCKRMTDLWSRGLGCSSADLHRRPRFAFARNLRVFLRTNSPSSRKLLKTFGKQLVAWSIRATRARIHSFRQLETANIHSIESVVSIGSMGRKFKAIYASMSDERSARPKQIFTNWGGACRRYKLIGVGGINGDSFQIGDGDCGYC